MLYSQDRGQLRDMFFTVWRKLAQGRPLEPIEAIVAEVIRMHPEYHGTLDDPAARERDYLPELGESNPFLHMALHIAIKEQLTADRPPGVGAAHAALLARCADTHEAEHLMLECMAESLWQAQRSGAVPAEDDYLDCLRRAGRR
jgi:hypothetical protein